MRIIAAIAVMLCAAVPLQAQPEPGMAMPEGIRGEMIGQLLFAQGRILDLEGAFPQNTFTWRPAEGVRSVSELFLHAAFGNYVFLSASGYDIPADAGFEMNPQKWDRATTDKEEIASTIRKSFEAAIAAVRTMPEEDLERTVKVFGMEMTVRNFMVTMVAHLHEHLGQGVAYARMNGVVPPWTAKAENEGQE